MQKPLPFPPSKRSGMRARVRVRLYWRERLSWMA
ncbi:hypothetical protein CPAR01_06048 [Colletotrichum paranaense]|uniref:Uncharacterized protein n=2 Tax=Colletotrichum acutatum species complex TaxID=2707335 RepID=A0AAI9UIR6_9PEZI|nr:uncharacterized protein CPAR01_06048 [Colletotrichum paranaense]KAK1459111.1 hypothetical protein CMEL01_02110 [Colletotrichum melonis]KAK1542661.1 hypothetical protein CPAR01_06048 [Colletotrichum paranaense]